MKTTLTIAAALSTALLLGAAAPGPGQHREVLRRRQGRQERLPDRELVCAGTSKKDAEASAWIGVPKGTCEKIIGGKLSS